MHVWVQSRYRVFAEGVIALLERFDVRGSLERQAASEVALVDMSALQPPFPHPPDLPTLAIAQGDDRTVLALLKRQYRGTIKPSDEAQLLVQALRAVRRGELWVERRLMTAALVADETPKLTPKQNEVLQYLAKGMSNRAIGQVLGISEGTVKMHVTQVYSKLGVENRAELLARVLGG
ncbi:MAG TPA: response regulator transcription factor [Trueperaceae bacterium]|nr:response regulator transcription factor [Trueperaceae bacterium]